MRIFGTHRRNPGSRLARTAILAAAASLAASTALAAGVTAPASAATPLNIFVGYMDTHTAPSSSSQPNPWPYTDPSSYVGSPCSNFGHTTTCWDASALRLENPGSSDVTGVQAEVDIGSKVYKLWGTSLTVKAHGPLVLTETGAQNSTNFDGSDYPPNAYNGGNFASCANSGAIPAVKITIAGTATTYLDSGQVLNGGGVDRGNCLNGTFVSGRMDESRQWTQIGGESGTPVASNVTATSYTDTSVTNGTTYYYTVAAVNSVGISARSSEVSATPQPPASAAYVRRAGSVTASSSRTTTSVPVSSPGVVAGHTLVVSMLLSSTSSITGAVSITDSAGNSYVLARDVNDGSAGDRTVVFVGVNVKALPAGGSITLTYPSSAETHVSADEFAGISAIDTSAGATGTTAAFSSGSTPATSQASELLIGSVGIESGKAPTWSAGWTALPTLSVSSDFLGSAYRIVTATGSYAATGTTSGQWMAGIVTLKTS